jgi:hypothetical protein
MGYFQLVMETRQSGELEKPDVVGVLLVPREIACFFAHNFLENAA